MSFRILKSKPALTIAAFVLTFAFAGGVFAQSSSVTGSVTDQTGAAVPGATVKITNPATGSSRMVVTDGSGNYSFPGLAPATYRVEVEAANFKKAVNNNVKALVDSTASIDIVLEAGTVTETVDVTTNTIESVVNTEDASLGNNFVPEQITQLPTNLRRVNDLLTLQPGVTREGYVAGVRSDQSNITLDGVDINDQQTGGRTEQFQTSQGSVLRATTESVEEFRITTSNANANQGRSSGAQISLVTKSGSNNLNGSLFYFYRPTQFSANNFFNNRASQPRPSLARDVYGGSIGGPIIKDRLFFFYSYEGQQQTLGQSVTRTVPLAHMGQGEMRFGGTGPTCNNGNCVINLADFNAIFNQVGANPAAIAVFAGAASRYPSNTTAFGDDVNTGGFTFNAPTTIKENTHIGRFDYRINDSQELFFRMNYQWDNTAGTSAFPDTPATSLWEHPVGGVIGHTATLSSTMINNFRAGLTRQSFSQQGDSGDNAISFRFVYSPALYARTLSRVTPVYNFTDDFTWIKDNHTIQIGGNVRLINNKRDTFASAFDNAITNPSFYNLSGAVVSNQVANAGYTIDDANVVQAAATAIIGRYSQYAANFTFDLDGNTLAAGSPSSRNFATQEYDTYLQDRWKARSDLTITLGVRYALSRPVYEKNGFQVVPSQRLGDVFELRTTAAAQGVPANPIIQFERAGPANNGQGFYSMDWNNVQPRIAFAYSPGFDSGFGHFLFGNEGDSTIRGGFAITNDYFGGQLAVSFDGLSTIGFTSSSGISANTFDVTGNPGPLFTGFGQDVRGLPGIPAALQRFSTPADEAQRIEVSLDGTIVSPTHYAWNASYGRSLPGGMYVEASYVGHAARNLFANRDVMALNNLVDPVSGMDYYTAMNLLVDARLGDVPFNNIGAIAFWENMFPNAMAAINGAFGLGAVSNTAAVYGLVARDGFDIADLTFVQLIIDDATAFGLPVNPGKFPNMFFHPQYAAFSSFGTTAYSDYHGGTFSLRQRLGSSLSYDINYTLSKSMDNASGLSTGASYGSQFLLNPLRPDAEYSLSSFDTKHVLNGNVIFQLPIGKGRKYFSDMNAWADAVVGGWQLASVFRYNSGLAFSGPFDGAQWATNWNVQSNAVRIGNIPVASGGADRSTLNFFSDPATAFRNFRNARAGEAGDRNVFRTPSYSTIDLGLSKSFTMPWSENHKLQARWEVFNVANTQPFNAGNQTRSTFGTGTDPQDTTYRPNVPSSFGTIFDSIVGAPRSMQFGVRYSF